MEAIKCWDDRKKGCLRVTTGSSVLFLFHNFMIPFLPALATSEASTGENATESTGLGPWLNSAIRAGISGSFANS